MALTSQLGLGLIKKQTNQQNQAAADAALAASNQAAIAAEKKAAPITVTATVPTKEPTYMRTSSWNNLNGGEGQVTGGSASYTDEYGKKYTGNEAVKKTEEYEKSRASVAAPATSNSVKNTNIVNTPKVNGTSVDTKSSTVSSSSPNTVKSKQTVVASPTPASLTERLEAAKAKYGASDPRVQRIEELIGLKNSRANTSTGNNIKVPDVDSLGSKIDRSGAEKTKDELELDPRTGNLIGDAIDTAGYKNDQKSDIITDANEKVEADTTEYKDKYEAEFESYKQQLEEREASLKAMEAEQRSKIEAWNKEQNDALANRQMGNQAEATQKLGKLGASDTVLANAQNEVRNNPVFQEQKAALQKQYIDTLSSTTKDYQTMYDNILQNKTGMTESKRALAEQLLSKINENTEKISTIKQSGIDEMFKPVETFQAARIEDSSNAELSSKQNSEAQYRWTGMDESARIAKLKDALYNYDPSISRAGLSPSDFETAAKEGDITKAVAILATTARNLTRAGAGTTATGKATTSETSTAQALAKQLINDGYKTLEQVTKVLSTKNLTDEQKLQITNAFKQELGWKAPLKAGVTEYESNATVEAYKKANNVK